MGAGSAGGNGNQDLGSDSFVNKKSKVKKVERTKFGYTKPKKENKVVNFAKTVLKKTTPGIVYDQIKQGIDERKSRTKKQNLQTIANAFPIDNSNRDGEASRVQAIEYVPTIIKKTAGGQTVQVTAPTEAELSQSAAVDADADDIYTRKKKSKARGRSMMTLTSAQGIKDNKLTLSKPSLLGS